MHAQNRSSKWVQLCQTATLACYDGLSFKTPPYPRPGRLVDGRSMPVTQYPIPAITVPGRMRYSRHKRSGISYGCHNESPRTIPSCHKRSSGLGREMWKDLVAINGSECVRALICFAIDDPLGGG